MESRNESESINSFNDLKPFSMRKGSMDNVFSETSSIVMPGFLQNDGDSNNHFFEVKVGDPLLDLISGVN